MLSQKDIVIQPYYLSDNRKSESNELSAIRIITEKLLLHPNTKCQFLPLIIIEKQDRLNDNDITETYKNMYEQDFFGSQYEWLAIFSKENSMIELSIHEDDKALNLIKKYGRLMKINIDSTGVNYIVDIDHSNESIVKLFANYRLPLAEYSKLKMKEEYINGGYEEIMKLTWFCFSPIDNKPCGLCNPCKYTIEEGMDERFDKIALARYKRRNSRIYKAIAKVKRCVKNIFD